MEVWPSDVGLLAEDRRVVSQGLDVAGVVLSGLTEAEGLSGFVTGTVGSGLGFGLVAGVPGDGDWLGGGVGVDGGFGAEGGRDGFGVGGRGGAGFDGGHGGCLGGPPPGGGLGLPPQPKQSRGSAPVAPTTSRTSNKRRYIILCFFIAQTTLTGANY